MFFYESYRYGDEDYFTVISQSNYSFSMHFHRCYEIIHVKSGILAIKLQEKDLTLEAGQAAIVCPYQLHSFTSVTETELVLVLFSPDLIGHFSTAFRNKQPINPLLSLDFSDIESLPKQNLYRKKAFLYSLCASLLEQTQFEDSHASDNSRLHQVLHYISEHYREKCELSTVANQLGYDYAYLSRLVKKGLQQSYTEYLNQYRITQACRLLTLSQLSVSDIGLQCGYDTLRSFHRNFKKITGMTPLAYRNLHPQL